MSAPDLQRGVRIRDIGAMLTGKVGDDEVLLVRKGEEFFAVDALCTHYHAPLADGLVVGETIRCPWHHACFDLRTGSPSGAPAMRPLRTWPVVRDGDTVRVIAHIAIVGAGAAGSFAAAELRRSGFGGRITLLSSDERPPYDKPNLSKDYLAGRAPADWIPLRSEDEYKHDRIELRLGTTVESIDTTRNEIALTNGERIAFDRLILATGARPRRLDVPAAREVHYLRTWSDADALRDLPETSRVVVIGASFIGLETAASLRERGFDVTVIGAEERPLERVLGREIGDFVRELHESHGVRFRLGRRPIEIRNDGVFLDDGSVEACEVVVAGIGVEPEITLAQRAGLTIDRGIVVNELLQTSVPNIFAAGDAARFPHAGKSIRVEHWVAAARQGQIAARNAMGRNERFTAVPFFWSQHYDLVFAYIGHAERADDTQTFGSLADRNAAVIYRDGGRIAAVATLFRDDLNLAIEAAMERNASDEELLDLVRRAF